MPEQATTKDRRSWGRDILIALVILAITAIAYIPAMRAGFIWDDDQYLTTNPVIKSPDGLRRIWFVRGSTPQYYPLVFTLFRIENGLWGFNPAGYHVVNILLCALSAVLLWRILKFLSVPGAWFAAVIFAVHPVQVESVAWVTELKNVLSGFFYLSAGLLALKFYLAEEGKRRRWDLWVGALLLFICALLSKTVACSLPAALLLVIWWKRGRIRLFDVLSLLPFFIVGVGLALNTAVVEKEHVGALGEAWNFTFIQRCLIAGRALWFYAGKLIWPFPLTFVYPRWNIDSAAVWQYAYPAAVVAAVAALWFLRRRIGRGPLVAVLFFAGTLTPALGFINVYPMRFSFVADHFQYHASIGLIVLAVAAAASWAGANHRSLAAGCGVLIIGALCVLTWRQCYVYHDLETLWRDTLRKNPNASMAWNNLGGLLRDKSIFAPENTAIRDEALHCFEEAIRLDPKDPLAHNNRGIILGRMGKLAQAIQEYDKAIELEPKLVEAYSNRGNAYSRLQKFDLALRDYDKAISLNANDPDIYQNRGNLYGKMGRADLALQDFNTAIQLAPNSAILYTLRAMACYSLRDYSKAIADVKQAQSLGAKVNPDFLQALDEVSGQMSR